MLIYSDSSSSPSHLPDSNMEDFRKGDKFAHFKTKTYSFCPVLSAELIVDYLNQRHILVRTVLYSCQKVSQNVMQFASEFCGIINYGGLLTTSTRQKLSHSDRENKPFQVYF